ncbi:MAG: ThiF family adenylyltransferase [Bacilli bacterium]|nr:ThiF family adenylyltransferase [Bacilli bacterium]
MEKRLERIASLIGEDQVVSLKGKTVLVCGLGGVGGTALESLARSGIGHFVIVDFDIVEPTNLNRQILYTAIDVGELKIAAAESRIKSIDQSIIIDSYARKVDSDFIAAIKNQKIDFVIDAIDSIEAKAQLITYCLTYHVAFISSLGMANRLDPTAVRVTNLAATHTDPLAKKLRSLLHKEEIDLNYVPVVFSIEKPRQKGIHLASVMNVPSAAGLAMAFYCLENIQK